MFYDQVKESADYIQSKTAQKPTIGIVLGSGLGSIVDTMEGKEVISYADIPNFPQSNVAGHAGNLVLGKIGSQTVVAMQGRVHFYEGLGMKDVTYAIYVMKLLGAENLIVTNACGGINTSFQAGDLMIQTDFINMLGTNSLMGDNDERFGVRFPDMSEPYSKEVGEKARKIAKRIGVEYKEGVYAIFCGPCYETAAEIRAYANLGADAVGMSTVPEVIAANYLGMKVLGISCITNMATGIAKKKHAHEEVVKIANQSSEKLYKWIKALLIEW